MPANFNANVRVLGFPKKPKVDIQRTIEDEIDNLLELLSNLLEQYFRFFFPLSEKCRAFEAAGSNTGLLEYKLLSFEFVKFFNEVSSIAFR